MDQVRSKLRSQYIFGPDLLNIISSVVMADARSAVENGLRGYDFRSVILTGWSRGGAAAIQLAREMADGRSFGRCLTVEALILLDAVDRAVQYSSDPIPSNVLHCYHAYRDPRVGSRPLFGNTGMQWEGHPDFKPVKFWATHSAFGGMPGASGSSASVRLGSWSSHNRCFDLLYTDTSISCAEDVASARQIAKWMSSCFARHGLSCSFSPIVPANCASAVRKELVIRCEQPGDWD